MELQKKSKATSILHFQLCHDIPCKNEFIIFILQELLEDMVPEDTGDNADTNELPKPLLCKHSYIIELRIDHSEGPQVFPCRIPCG